MNVLNRIIDLSLRHRLLVISAALAAAVAGVVALGRLDVDAFPDTTPVQVQINTVAPALGPEYPNPSLHSSRRIARMFGSTVSAASSTLADGWGTGIVFFG